LQAGFADIICINRYYAWYSDTGYTEVITASMVQDVHNWIAKFNRPLIVAEYGADTVAGLHSVSIIQKEIRRFYKGWSNYQETP